MQMSQRTSEQGFTVLELGIVLLITAVLMVAFTTGTLSYMQKAKIKATKIRLQTIDKSLQEYLSVNGAYPCPARLDSPQGDTDFGVAIRPNNPAPLLFNCAGGGVAGTRRVLNTRGYTSPDGAAYNLNVRIGAVPVRALNLPDEFVADAWNDRFTYAVTEELTDVTRFFQNSGGIAVVDSGSNTVVKPEKTAHYALVSHGADQKGSYDYSTGEDLEPCAPGAELDDENCDDGDATFLKTLLTTGVDTAGASQYDDFVIFAAQEKPVEIFPEGAVAAFDISVPAGDLSAGADPCPPGWTHFTDADERMIVEMDATNPDYTLGAQQGAEVVTIEEENMPPHQHPLSQTSNLQSPGVTTIHYRDGTSAGATLNTLGTGSGIAINIRNPYIALLFCRKN